MYSRNSDPTLLNVFSDDSKAFKTLVQAKKHGETAFLGHYRITKLHDSTTRRGPNGGMPDEQKKLVGYLVQRIPYEQRQQKKRVVIRTVCE